MTTYNAVIKFSERYDLTIQASDKQEAMRLLEEYIERKNNEIDINDRKGYGIDYVEDEDGEVIYE